MSTNQNANQFAQTFTLGQVDLEITNGSVVTVAISPNQATSLVAGQFVKIDSTVTVGLNQLPAVVALASAADTSCGVILRNLKDQNFPANARAEMAIDNACVVLQSDTSNYTIGRFTPVEASYTTPGSVQAWQGINPIVGYAYDGSTAAGTLIRCIIKPPVYTTSGSPKVATITATLAQINAGLVLIPGVTGKKITVLNVVNRSVGAFATGTSIELESTNASPVAVLTYLEAAIGSSAVLFPNSANVTVGAGFAAPLGSGDGLQVVNNGSAQTGGTSQTYSITYTQA